MCRLKEMKNINRDQRTKFRNVKMMMKALKCWIIYKEERKNRKGKRRIRKFEAKILKLIFKRHNQGKKMRAL